ncbi:MAG: hypothetical protein PHC64_10355 [Candidatus Gastranaerophilales bacterium]|nr:hypothetical protein [Candidatus Gastranaerophilales bacterium]
MSYDLKTSVFRDFSYNNAYNPVYKGYISYAKSPTFCGEVPIGEPASKKNSVGKILLASFGIAAAAIAVVATHKTLSFAKAVEEAGLKESCQLKKSDIFFNNLNVFNWFEKGKTDEELLGKGYEQFANRGCLFTSKDGDVLYVSGRKTFQVKDAEVAKPSTDIPTKPTATAIETEEKPLVEAEQAATAKAIETEEKPLAEAEQAITDNPEVSNTTKPRGNAETDVAKLTAARESEPLSPQLGEIRQKIKDLEEIEAPLNLLEGKEVPYKRFSRSLNKKLDDLQKLEEGGVSNREKIDKLIEIRGKLSEAAEPYQGTSRLSATPEQLDALRECDRQITAYMKKTFDIDVLSAECLGKPFDPKVQRAVDNVSTNDPKMNGIIADIVQDGYRGPITNDAGQTIVQTIRPTSVMTYKYSVPAVS